MFLIVTWLISGYWIGDFYLVLSVFLIWKCTHDYNIAPMGNNDFQYEFPFYEFSTEMWIFIVVGIVCTPTF
jgi:hypothetical protein